MASFSHLSLAMRPLDRPKGDILPQVKRAEKKTFPSYEVFDFERELKKRNVELLVVLDTSKAESQLAAYLVIAHLSRTIMIHKLCVLQHHRRRGIAKRLIAMLQQRSKARGCDKIQLWVDEKRIPAKCLYVATGFREISKVQNYYSAGRTAISIQFDLL